MELGKEELALLVIFPSTGLGEDIIEFISFLFSYFLFKCVRKAAQIVGTASHWVSRWLPSKALP